MVKTIKPTKYLYDIEPTDFINKPYQEAIEYKVMCGKALINKLLEEHYYCRDDERVNAVFKAIKFNEQLLDELK